MCAPTQCGHPELAAYLRLPARQILRVGEYIPAVDPDALYCSDNLFE